MQMSRRGVAAMIEYKIYNWAFDSVKWAGVLDLVALEIDDRTLGEILGVDRSTVNNWRKRAYRLSEYDFPSMSNFIKVCNVLDLDPRDFYALVIP